MKWHVKTVPVPENPSAAGKNESGVVVSLENERGEKVEVSRVLFVRRNAMNKSVGFKRQLLKEMDKAFEACEVLNESYIAQDDKDAQKNSAVEEAERRRQVLLEKLQKENTPNV